MAQLPHNQGPSRDRGIVDCHKCHSPIFIDKPGNVALEFSVPCAKCGHRGMYFKRMIRDENDPVERRHSVRG